MSPDGRSTPATKASTGTAVRQAHLKRIGLDEDTYNRVLRAQGGQCAICRSKPRTARLVVDHDHDTGALRGLLCMRCNHKLLGGARDSVVLLQAAIGYLTSPPAPKAVGLVIVTARPGKVTRRKPAKG